MRIHALSGVACNKLKYARARTDAFKFAEASLESQGAAARHGVRAFSARAICCACARLTPTRPEASAKAATMRMLSPRRRRSRGSRSHTTRLKQIARDAELSSRPMVMSCRINVAPWMAAFRISSTLRHSGFVVSTLVCGKSQ